MPFQIIYTTTFNHYQSVNWQGEPIYLRHNQFRQLLAQELGGNFEDLLAIPDITTRSLIDKGKGYWKSRKFTKEAVPLTSFSQEEQQPFFIRLHAIIVAIENLANQLQISGDQEKRDLGKVLDKVLTVPNLNHILIENGEFVFVAWGFKSTQEKFKNFDLKTIVAALTNPQPAEIIKLDDTPKDKSVGEDKLKPENTGTLVKEGKSEKKSKRYLWGLLSLLLFFLLIYWFWNRTSANILPSEPNIIVPIDTTDLIVDPVDSLNGSIVGNRINISLHKGTDIKAFAKKFKVKYASKDYKIIYIDDHPKINHLQLQIPKDERIDIKSTLKNDFEEIRLVWSERVFENKQPQSTLPNDPAFQIPNNQWAYERIKVYDAWDITQGSSEVVIAVIDDGFDLKHPELRNSVKNPWNIINRSKKMDIRNGKAFHGTHVAGTAMGIANNNEGLSGIAPNCKLMPIQIGDENGLLSGTAIINGIIYALNQEVDVINLSIGKQVPIAVSHLSIETQKGMLSLSKDEEQLWTELFQMVEEAGIVIVNAVGNSNVYAGIDPMNRNNISINVAATDQNNIKAIFSNYGKNHSTVSAPGVKIFSSMPNGKYALLDGTSMATPMVTGAVALMKSLNKNLSPKAIKQILVETGLPMLGDEDNGIGPLIQLDKALKKCQNDETCFETIDSLQRIIDELRRQINDSIMVIPENPQDLSFTIGKWKSTSPLINSNQEVIELLFDIKQDEKGKLTLREKNGTTCTADLDLSLKGKELIINQVEEATCKGGDYYAPYTIKCKTVVNGEAECIATNKRTNQKDIVFQLIRLE